MNEKRRTTLLALLTGALAGAALIAARRGVPGARHLATNLARRAQPQAPAKLYGYKEVNLS
ncbi:MAG: hypothetical protein ACOY93_06280 [Bacillota bacterium]